MNVRKLILIEQNKQNFDVVLEPIRKSLSIRNYDRLMDSALAKEGLIFLNYELGPTLLRYCHNHYTYLFIPLLQDMGRIFRRWEVGTSHRDPLEIDPVVSLLATWCLHDLHDATFDEALTQALVKEIANDVMKANTISPATRRCVLHEVKAHLKKHTYKGQYYARTTLIVAHQPK